MNEDLASIGRQYADVRNAVKSWRAELDNAVRRSREDGMTYAAIAKEIGLSIAWVQASLWRTSPEQESD